MKISSDPRVKKLVASAEKGDVAAVRRLLDEGADPNAFPEDGTDTALFAAIYHWHVEVIRALAGTKAEFNAGWPHTPLTVGVRTKDLDLIRALVEGGAKVNTPNSSGETALFIAVQNGDVATVAELVRLGADPNLIPQKKKYDTVTNYSPIQYAAMAGDKKIIAALTSAPGGKDDKTLPALLLCGAATKGDLVEVKRLIEQEGVDVNARDLRGDTPLINAALWGRTKVVRYLLDHGADVNLPGGKKSDGNNPLIAAALSGKVPIVQMLLEAGADFDYEPKDFPGGNALAQAKEERRKKVVEYLLEVQKQRGGAKKAAGPRGVTTFDTNDAMFLVAASVADVAKAFAARVGATKWRENVLGEEVKVTKRCYAVWKLADSPWTNLQKVHCRDFKHWPSPADAAALSKSLQTRALFVANSDTGGVTQYALFDGGKLVEIFDYGSAGDTDSPEIVTGKFAQHYGLDMADIAGGVQVKKNKTFASTLCTVDVAKIQNDLDFVNDYINQQGAFVPFGFNDAWGEAGETAELSLEGLGPDDIERLDYVAVK